MAMKIIGIALLIFSILTIITYLIIRFTTKSTVIIGSSYLLMLYNTLFLKVIPVLSDGVRQV